MFDVDGLTEKKLMGGKRIRGENLTWTSNQSLKEAIDDALNKGNGDVMVDAVVYYHVAPFNSGYIVEGRVINSRQ
jgi:flavin-binding protein dodecin